MADIKILGKIAAGRADGVLLDDSVICGGYKVVQSIDERDALPMATRTIGMPVYVHSENNTYRWNGEGWDAEEIFVTSISEDEIIKLFLMEE